MAIRRDGGTGGDPGRGRAAGAIAAIACLLLVAAACALLPSETLRLALPAGAHLIHLLAAACAGRALLRLPRAAPRGALDLTVTCVALGLGALAIIVLGLGLLGWISPWTPWIADAVALAAGARHLRDSVERLLEPWRMREMAVVVASRVPLFALLGTVVLPHAVAPFLPLSRDTGSAALALASQAAVRGDLPGALAALPGTAATPVEALLLMGWLTGGPVGARLFAATFVALLAAAAWLHVERHMGSRTAGWSLLVLATCPVTLAVGARNPSLSFTMAIGFLVFHEIADWSQRAAGGKIALASIYGGLLLAESARGATVFASLLAFVLLVQGLVDGRGLLRQIPGISGMAGIALLTALPFVLLSTALDRSDPVSSLATRYLPSSSSSPDLDRLASALEASPERALSEVALSALWLGPLLLGLLLLVPLAPAPPEALRHGVLAAFLALLVGLAPPPYGTWIGLVAPACVAAGGTAVTLLARRGTATLPLALFLALAVPGSLLLALARGPDVGSGLAVLLGRLDPEEHRARSLPDAPLLDAIAARRVVEGQSVLVVGTVSIAHVRAPVARTAGGEATAERVAFVAVDAVTAGPAAAPLLTGPPLLPPFGPGGRFRLLGPPEAPAPRRPPAPVEAVPDAEPPAPDRRKEPAKRSTR